MPETLLQVIASRPELAAYEPKLQWVKAQMEYAHGMAQAHFVSGSENTLQELDKQSSAGGSDASGSSEVVWF